MAEGEAPQGVIVEPQEEYILPTEFSKKVVDKTSVSLGISPIYDQTLSSEHLISDPQRAAASSIS